MRLRTLVILGALIGAFAATTPAAAQQRTVTTYRTAPAAPADRVVVVDEPGVYRAPHRHMLRFRFGIDATGGAMVRTGPDIGFGGLRARLGLQLGDWFAIYYQPTGLVGGFMNSPRGDSVAGVLFNTGMLEVTLFHMVQLGVGPSADFIWGCADSPQTRPVCNDRGPFFGIDGRVAVAIDPYIGGSRMGMTISADVHPTWFDREHIGMTVLGGIGFEVF